MGDNMGQVPEFRKHHLVSRLPGLRFCLTLFQYADFFARLCLAANVILINADATSCTDVGLIASSAHGQGIRASDDSPSVSCQKIFMTRTSPKA
jgi:hypothetical protein